MSISRFTTLVSMITLAGGATVLVAQGKPKTVATVPATLTFQCGDDAPDGPCALDASNKAGAGADRLRGDGAGYSGTVSDVVFFYRSYNTRYLRMLLGAPFSGSVECAQPAVLAGCNPDLQVDRGYVRYDGGETRLNDFELQIKPVDPGSLENRDGGLVGLPCEIEFPALVHLTVRMPEVEGHWGLNFNRRAYHSRFATVVRTGNYTWTVHARPNNSDDIGDTAELVAFNHRGLSRRSGPSHEGLFTVPFSLTIDSGDKLPTRSTRCQAVAGAGSTQPLAR